MTTLAAKKRRERTNTNRKRTTQQFNAPGVYQPVFGKASIYISGQGQPGTAPQNAALAGYNPPTPGNVSGSNPIVPGNVAYYNAPVAGTYAGTYAPSGGNVAYYNPDVPGNVSGYNPSVPGNVSYNAPTPGQIVYMYTTYQYSNPPYYSEYVSGYFVISPYTNYNSSQGSYSVVSVSRPSGFYVPGNSFYNPSVGGTANYNPGNTGNAVYNPYTPGTAYYNPTIPGNAVYNATTGGTANYNPSTPGNANYNNYVEGTPGVPFTALGVTFPGGAVGAPAPVVGKTLTYAPYLGDGQGYPINVPTGANVNIEET